MERLVKGDIVVMHFPFSDLTGSKKRPAIVIATPLGNDPMLCQITSKQTKDAYSIPLMEKEFKSGSLNQDSNIRPNKIFTADTSIISYKIGKLKPGKTTKVVEAVCEIIRN